MTRRSKYCDDVSRVARSLKWTESGCWEFSGSKNQFGYGMVKVGGRSAPVRPAHRIVYENLVGPIEDGLVLDHLCRNRACVNPFHLEPVTHRTNILRGNGATAKKAAMKSCQKCGGDFSFRSRGERTARFCKPCDLAGQRSRYEKKKLASK